MTGIERLERVIPHLPTPIPIRQLLNQPHPNHQIWALLDRLHQTRVVRYTPDGTHLDHPKRKAKAMNWRQTHNRLLELLKDGELTLPAAPHQIEALLPEVKGLRAQLTALHVVALIQLDEGGDLVAVTDPLPTDGLAL